MLFLKEEIPMKPPKHNFKFMNSSITLDGFHEKVRENWNMHMDGEPMKVPWNKLRRLQPVMRKMNKKVTAIQGKIDQTRKI